MRANPDKLAKLCSDCFPVKPIEVIKGDTVVRIDSVLRVDSVRVQVDCPDGTKVDCPPNKTIYKTRHTHSTDTVKIRDTAFETVLINERDKVIKDRDRIVSSRDGWRTASLWGWGIIGGYLLIVFIRKRLP